MTSAPRPGEGPLPGDLFLDPAVPECERMTLARNGWTAQASHLWTGTGWVRLVPGTVREVPTHQLLPPSVAPSVQAPAHEGVDEPARPVDSVDSVDDPADPVEGSGHEPVHPAVTIPAPARTPKRARRGAGSHHLAAGLAADLAAGLGAGLFRRPDAAELAGLPEWQPGYQGVSSSG